MKNYDLGGITVLIVDGNFFLRNTIKSILRMLGVQHIVDASSLKAGWNEFRHEKPDIVIIDWSPGFDGLSLLKKIRHDDDSPNPCVPVIIASTMTERETVEAARDSGATDFLAEPISPQTVYEHLCSLRDHPHPFVRTTMFFGPDRRHRSVDVNEDRRH